MKCFHEKNNILEDMQTQKSLEVLPQPVQLCLRKKLPFADSVARLHRSNLRVGEVCHQVGVTQVEQYNLQKEQYWSEAKSKEERVKRMLGVGQEKRRHLRNTHIQAITKNEMKLSQLQELTSHKRQEMMEKEHRMGKQSYIRRIKFTEITPYKTVDLEDQTTKRQSQQLQRSLDLLAQHGQKISAANLRRAKAMGEIKQLLREQNRSVLLAQQTCRARDILKQNVSCSKIISKYQTADKFYVQQLAAARKKGRLARKDRDRVQQEHARRHVSLEEAREQQRNNEIQRQQTRIQEANRERQRQLMVLTQNISTNRELRQQRIIANTSCFEEEQQKRAALYQQSEHRSRLFLLQLKQQKQCLRGRNLHELTLRH